MNDGSNALLGHLLATIAYRLQASLRGAPADFGDFDAGHGIRPPREIVRHVTAVLGYALSFFGEENPKPERLATLDAELERLHARLALLGGHVSAGDEPSGTSWDRLVQGPFADALTHVGQLALLRRIAGSPVAGENFLLAAVDRANLGSGQPPPAAPRRP